MADSTGQEQLMGSEQGVDLAAWKKRYDDAKAVRERFIPDWYMNLAFYLGQQWMTWAGGRLDIPRLAPWRRMPVDNRILPIVTARAARKVKNRPVFVGTPATGDEDDIIAAKVAEQVLASDWQALDLQQALYRSILYADICGAGFWKVYWDSTKGAKADYLFNADGSPFTQANGAPVRADVLGGNVPEGLVVKSVGQGDVCVDVLSPFEIYPDPLATSLNDAEYIVEEKVRSLEYVRSRFGRTDIIADSAAPVGPVESRMSPSMFYTGGFDSAERRGVRVYEGWMRPSTEYPNGCRTVWANDKVLGHDTEPFDPMPYIMFSGITAPNRFWPTSIVTQLRGPQVDLNKIEAQVMENAARIGNPALMKSRQANVHYTGVPGEEILYDSTVTDAVPSYLESPEVPGYVREQIDRIERSMQEISGLHETSSGQVPSGITAASAINLLQEADDTRLGPEIHDIERTLEVGGTKILKLRAAFNTDERLIRLAGEDGNWDIFAFKGQMLNDEPAVTVQAGSGMPRSKAAKQAAMHEVLSLALQYGMQFKPRDLRRFFKDYEVGGLERLFETSGQDETQVNRENRQMSQGIPLNINKWDDDEVHVEGHNEYRKTQAYSRLSPQNKGIIDLHVAAHKERQVQATNSQMEVMSTETQQQQLAEQTRAMEEQAAEVQMQPTNNNGGSS